MKNKKFLNGTEFGSRSETATKKSSAQNGAATGFEELDDTVLEDITGGEDFGSIKSYEESYQIRLIDTEGKFFGYFKCASLEDQTAAEKVLNRYVGQNVTYNDMKRALLDAGIELC